MPPLPPTRQLIPLALAGLLATAIVAFIVVVLFMSWFSNPPFGWGNAPDQPIPFPHTVHAGAVEDGGHAIQCEFCHRNVTTGAAATVPAVEVCVICHKQINGANAKADVAEPETLINIQRVLDKHEDGRPIDWERVHRMPDHVRFVHEAHLRFLTQGEERDGNVAHGRRRADKSARAGAGSLHRLPRRRSPHGRSATAGGPIPQDGHVPGLPPGKQRKHGLYRVSQVGRNPATERCYQ